MLLSESQHHAKHHDGFSIVQGPLDIKRDRHERGGMIVIKESGDHSKYTIKEKEGMGQSIADITSTNNRRQACPSQRAPPNN